MELYTLSECYDIVRFRKTCWGNSCYWKIIADGYTMFQKNRKGREGGILLHVKQKIECMRLSYGDYRSSIPVKIRGIITKLESYDLLVRMMRQIKP